MASKGTAKSTGGVGTVGGLDAGGAPGIHKCDGVASRGGVTEGILRSLRRWSFDKELLRLWISEGSVSSISGKYISGTRPLILKPSIEWVGELLGRKSGLGSRLPFRL